MGVLCQLLWPPDEGKEQRWGLRIIATAASLSGGVERAAGRKGRKSKGQMSRHLPSKVTQPRDKGKSDRRIEGKNLGP